MNETDSAFTKTKARTYHNCENCGANITPGSYYYRYMNPRHIFKSFHAKKYCTQCVLKYGNELISNIQRKRKHASHFQENHEQISLESIIESENDT